MAIKAIICMSPVLGWTHTKSLPSGDFFIAQHLPAISLSLHIYARTCISPGMKNLLKKFPPAFTVDDNLKPGGRVYRFNAECYQNTNKAIQIWRDIWLPKSEIKIVWGEPQFIKGFCRECGSIIITELINKNIR